MSELELEIDTATRQQLQRFHFDEATFASLRRRLLEGCADDNLVKQPLTPPHAHDIMTLPPAGSAERGALHAAGRGALARGEVAALILAGGMGTRFGGMVKAAVEVLPGQTFLDLKLSDLAQRAEQAGRQLPVLIMTSFATDREVARLAIRAAHSMLSVQTFAQFISLRLQSDGALFRDQEGRLSPYAPGHGDLVPALERAGLLAALRAHGVRYLFLSNVDNLAATLEPAVLGAHVLGTAAITFEVAPMREGDQGGVPARLAGSLQVIEALRQPPDFVGMVPWLSINNMTFTLSELEQAQPLDWFRVKKTVSGQTAIQFERLVNQLTASLPSRALAVERDGLDCRFLPVKDPADLASHRPAIRELLERRLR